MLCFAFQIVSVYILYTIVFGGDAMITEEVFIKRKYAWRVHEAFNPLAMIVINWAWVYVRV